MDMLKIAPITSARIKLPIQLPPGPEDQFDIGDADDSLEKMIAYFKVYGDICRVYSPGGRVDTYVISRPDWVKRVLVTNHRNYTKGVGINRVKLLPGTGSWLAKVIFGGANGS